MRTQGGGYDIGNLQERVQGIEEQLAEELGVEGIQGQVDGHGDTIGDHAGRLDEQAGRLDAIEAALDSVGGEGLPDGCSEATCLQVDDYWYSSMTRGEFNVGHGSGSDGTCQSDYVALPVGWEIAPEPAEGNSTPLFNYGWGTHVLVFAIFFLSVSLSAEILAVPGPWIFFFWGGG